MNTRNLKLIPYNQEKMQIKHDALFLHISIYQLIRLCLTFCSLWRCKKQTADRNTPVIGKSPGSDTIKASGNKRKSSKTWNEPLHDKTNKMACASSEDSDQTGRLGR